MTNQEALEIIRDIKKNNPEFMQSLRDKCKWEQMNQVSVVKEWGDPRNW